MEGEDRDEVDEERKGGSREGSRVKRRKEGQELRRG